MKALLIKDFISISKQFRLILILILVFSAYPNWGMTNFAVIYSAMLPITALAYDERSKWNNFAFAMPFSNKSIVISKYLLGYIFLAVSMLLSSLTQFILHFITLKPLASNDIFLLLITVCIATIFLSVILPLLFKYGVEKGRLLFAICLGVSVSLFIAAAPYMADLISTYTEYLGSFSLILCLIAIPINLASMIISMKIFPYPRK